ncbi:MAG TPA: ABC transporter permease [Dehalococcoidia bacterium]|nr:ABC transporter permease [Dehalococcoidia bacterium]
MGKYAAQRLILMIPTVIMVTILTFLFLRVFLPADVIDLIIGEYGRNDPTLRANLEKELGLNGSLLSQYLRWVGVAWFYGGPKGILEGNLGESLHSGRSVVGELKRRVPVSFELGMWAQITSICFSVPLGVWAALKQDKWPDYGLRSIAILINSVPGFWIAVLIITFGSIWFNWAPPINFKYLTQDPIAHLKIMLLPSLIIGLTPSGGLIRLVRTQMLDVLREDYIRTAHAKGLSQNTVLYKHALRNALIPVITVIGVGLPNIIAGTVIFEQIFIIPGMGRYLVDAVNNLDYPVIEGLNLVFAALLMLAILLVDISYAFLDPRIRFR